MPMQEATVALFDGECELAVLVERYPVEEAVQLIGAALGAFEGLATAGPPSAAEVCAGSQPAGI